MTKKIALGHSKFALIDDEDHWFLIQWEWRFDRGYAVRDGEVNGKRKVVYMHRVILEQKLGHDDFEDTSHMNQNGLDNHKKNLEPSTKSQNQCNRGKQRNNTSGYKGVSWSKCAEKWYASIHINGKTKNLGLYDTKIMAARAYDLAAIKYFGKFACLNFPRSDYDS